jgi:hypothetical protein
VELREKGLEQQLAAHLQQRPSPEAARTPLIASLVLMPDLSRAETRVNNCPSIRPDRSRISRSNSRPGTTTRNSAPSCARVAGTRF